MVGFYATSDFKASGMFPKKDTIIYRRLAAGDVMHCYHFSCEAIVAKRFLVCPVKP